MDTIHNTFAVQGYEMLGEVLNRAYNQAAKGKGNERHATGEPFHEQPMQTISALVGNDSGLLFQAMKKIHESQRLNHAAGIAELLGAINYIAGAIIYREAHAGAAIENVENTLLRRASDREFLSGSLGTPFEAKAEKALADLDVFEEAERQAKALKKLFSAKEAAARVAVVLGDDSGEVLPEIQTDTQPKTIFKFSNSIEEFEVSPPVEMNAVESAPPADDGWITWGGGECPVPKKNFVSVALSDGSEFDKEAGNLNWSHKTVYNKHLIIKYKRLPTCNCGMLPAGACVHGVSCNDG